MANVVTTIPYQRCSPTYNVMGYVVHVEGPVSMDISFDFDEKLNDRYHNVISNKWQYEIPDPKDPENLAKRTFHEGIAYRCRLRGVKIAKDNQQGSHSLMKQAHIDMMRQINRQNGWVMCTISDVDKFQRILVDLYDPVTSANLRDILVNNARKPRYQHLFSLYPNHIDRRTHRYQSPEDSDSDE